MKKATPRFLLRDLLDSKIITAEGKTVGHVADIQLTHGPEYQIITLLFGTRGWLFRLHVLNPFRREKRDISRPKRVPWEMVESFDQGIVRLKPEYEHYKEQET